jgi:osmotically-inducible protein OsmY
VDRRDDKRALGAKVQSIKGVQEVNNRLRVRDQDTRSTADTAASSERRFGDLRAEDRARGGEPSRWWPPDRHVGAGVAGIGERQIAGSGVMAETDYTGTTGPSGTWTFSPGGGAIETSARVAKPAGDYAFTTLDRSLVAQIRVALNGDPSLPVSNENVHLKAVSGTVTIEGWVPSVGAKKAITAKVAEMPGVRGINNRLLVLSRPVTTQPD